MPRRSKGQSFFDDMLPNQDDYVPDPPSDGDLADDERAILAGREPDYSEPIYTGEETGPQPVSNPSEEQEPEAPPASGAAPSAAAKERRKAKRRADMSDATLVERVRERAGRGIFKRIKFYEQMLERSDIAPELKMRAAAKLDELAIGKAPTAPQMDKGRPKILVGAVGGGGFIRTIGDIHPDIPRPAKKLAEEGETFNA